MVRLSRITTGAGDQGKTSLGDGSRVSKRDARIAAIGAVEEANAAVGVARQHTAKDAEFDAMLAHVQNDLFDLGADLCLPGEEFADPGKLRLVPAQVERLERETESRNRDLEPLDSFVLPGGTPAAAYLHLARTVVRRAERCIAALAAAEPVNPVALQYANRLSDHLFVLSRVCNRPAGGDVLWRPGAHRES